MGPSSDADSHYVYRHARFRGLAPTPGQPGKYTVRIADLAGHEIEITASLDEVMRLAAEALRRTDGDAP